MYDCDYEKWSQYLLKEINANRTGKIRGVDLASGSGTMTILLKKAGLDLFGVDMSSDMIARAQEKSRLNAVKIDFVNCRCEEFESPRPLDFATMCLDAVNYVDRDSVLTLFENVYDNLKENGVFLFDISSKYKLFDYIGENVFYDDGEDVTYLWTNAQNKEGGYVDYNIIFFVKNGDSYNRFEEVHRLYIYQLEEIASWLYEAGFESVEVKGEDFGDEIKDECMRLHFIARK